MSRRRTACLARRLTARLVAGLSILALVPPLEAAAGTLEVRLLSPAPGAPVFGRVEVVFEVDPLEALRRAELHVDGRPAASFTGPPFRTVVDVGEANAEHRFVVVAESTAGERARAELHTPAIHVDEVVELSLQQLYVTVSRGGESVLDLGREAFEVRDEGEPQELVTFERGDVPLAALLLVDASHSMRGERLRAALAGARAFSRALEPLDRVKLVLFSDRLLHATPFTASSAVLEAGLEAVEARGSTALNDHLYLALEQLEEHQGRRLVVLLSDGIDVASQLAMREVTWSVRRSQALIYWIRLGVASTDLASVWRGPEDHREELAGLERAVALSGGRIEGISDAAQAEAAFAAILRELREQYVLGYYPSRSRGAGSWHRVEVRLRGRGLEARTREGYVERGGSRLR